MPDQTHKQDETLYLGENRKFEIGDVVDRRCDICNGAMSFQYLQSQGYVLVCVRDPNLDHMEMLTPQDIE